MSRRTGFSLIELLVAVGILAVLVGLVLAAVQKVRAAAVHAQSANNLRQIILATHQLSDQEAGRIKNLTTTRLPRKPVYEEQSIFSELIPWTYGPRLALPPNPTEDQIGEHNTPTVKAYRSPADPSVRGLHLPAWVNMGECSYACNMLVFDGAVTFPFAVPDGTASTLAYAERYSHTGSGGRNLRSLYQDIFPASRGGNDRRATFADKGWFDVLPVKDPATGLTVASDRGRTFQVRPTVEEADHRVLQTPFPGGLPVALFDGSVRSLSPTIAEPVFWALVTPAGGEVAGDF